MIRPMMLVAMGAVAVGLSAAPATSREPAAVDVQHPTVTDEARLVVSLTTGDVEELRRSVLTTIPALADHYRAQGRGLRAAVVVHGDAFKFVLRGDLATTQFRGDAPAVAAQAEVRAGLERLVREHGVRIEVCAAGLKQRGIAAGDLLPFVHTVPLATAGLIDWQQAGHALRPVG